MSRSEIMTLPTTCFHFGLFRNDENEGMVMEMRWGDAENYANVFCGAQKIITFAGVP